MPAPLARPYLLFLLLLPLAALSLRPAAAAERSAPWLHPQWLHLLRYEKTGLFSAGEFESQIINPGFFLSPEGGSSPSAEWWANLREARENPDFPCRFPARYSHLVQNGFVESGRPAPGTCPDLEYFRKKLQAESVSIVFAAFFINNPSSAFGHTLFKVRGQGEANALLAQGANFAATLTTSNPFLYAWHGLTGGFEGRFSALPYYFKIREYNQSENRDLWEYELNLSDEQVEFFVAHLWELNQARFRYYYLSENCSYHLLRLLDAIHPAWNLTERLSRFVMPTQTLAALRETPGLVRRITYRPSQFHVVEARHRELSPELKGEVRTRPASIRELSRGDKTAAQWAQLLDFHLDYLDARYSRALFFAEPESQEIQAVKNELLLARSELPPAPAPQIAAPSDSPESGHPERRWALGYFTQNNGLSHGPTFLYRFAFHDLFDRDEGRPRWSQLVMGEFRFQHDLVSGKPGLSRLSLARANSNPELLGLLGNFSWAWDFGLEDPLATPQRDLAGFASGALGATWWNSPALLVTTLVGATLRGSPAFRETFWWPELHPTLTVMTGAPFGKLGLKAQRHWVLSKAASHYSSLEFGASAYLGHAWTWHGSAQALSTGEKRIESRLSMDF